MVILSDSSLSQLISDSIKKKIKNHKKRENNVSAISKNILYSKIDFTLGKEQYSSSLASLKSKYGALTLSSQKSTIPPKMNNFLFDGIPKPKHIIFPAEKLEMTWCEDLKLVGSGLANLGNTCYLNSTLQCLTYTPPLANYFIKNPHSEKCHIQGFCMECEIGKHIKFCLSKVYNVYKPLNILRNLKCIAKHFNTYKQEDAHEFFIHILEAMQKSGINGYNKLDVISKQTTLINQIFGGYLRSRVICKLCQKPSDCYDPFVDISLDIKGTYNLNLALKRFVTSEIIQNENAYKCENCKRRVAASKRVTIHRSPRVCVFHLKRFTAAGNKITQFFEYPERFDMSPYMSNEATGGGDNLLSSHFPPPNSNQTSTNGQTLFNNSFDTSEYFANSTNSAQNMTVEKYASTPNLTNNEKAFGGGVGKKWLNTTSWYHLYAVLVHSGYSTNYGHYFCYCKGQNGLWYRMDDANVTQSNLQKVLKQEAYLLFYIQGNHHPNSQSFHPTTSKIISNNLLHPSPITYNGNGEAIQNYNSIKPAHLPYQNCNALAVNQATAIQVKSSAPVNHQMTTTTSAINQNLYDGKSEIAAGTQTKINNNCLFLPRNVLPVANTVPAMTNYSNNSKPPPIETNPIPNCNVNDKKMNSSTAILSSLVPYPESPHSSPDSAESSCSNSNALLPKPEIKHPTKADFPSQLTRKHEKMAKRFGILVSHVTHQVTLPIPILTTTNPSLTTTTNRQILNISSTPTSIPTTIEGTKQHSLLPNKIIDLLFSKPPSSDSITSTKSTVAFNNVKGGGLPSSFGKSSFIDTITCTASTFNGQATSLLPPSKGHSTGPPSHSFHQLVSEKRDPNDLKLVIKKKVDAAFSTFLAPQPSLSAASISDVGQPSVFEGEESARRRENGTEKGSKLVGKGIQVPPVVKKSTSSCLPIVTAKLKQTTSWFTSSHQSTASSSKNGLATSELFSSNNISSKDKKKESDGGLSRHEMCTPPSRRKDEGEIIKNIPPHKEEEGKKKKKRRDKDRHSSSHHPHHQLEVEENKFKLAGEVASSKESLYSHHHKTHSGEMESQRRKQGRRHKDDSKRRRHRTDSSSSASSLSQYPNQFATQAQSPIPPPSHHRHRHLDEDSVRSHAHTGASSRDVKKSSQNHHGSSKQTEKSDRKLISFSPLLNKADPNDTIMRKERLRDKYRQLCPLESSSTTLHDHSATAISSTHRQSKNNSRESYHEENTCSPNKTLEPLSFATSNTVHTHPFKADPYDHNGDTTSKDQKSHSSFNDSLTIFKPLRQKCQPAVILPNYPKVMVSLSSDNSSKLATQNGNSKENYENGRTTLTTTLKNILTPKTNLNETAFTTKPIPTWDDAIPDHLQEDETLPSYEIPEFDQNGEPIFKTKSSNVTSHSGLKSVLTTRQKHKKVKRTSDGQQTYNNPFQRHSDKYLLKR